jgi:hypothetical protein
MTDNRKIMYPHVGRDRPTIFAAPDCVEGTGFEAIVCTVDLSDESRPIVLYGEAEDGSLVVLPIEEGPAKYYVNLVGDLLEKDITEKKYLPKKAWRKKNRREPKATVTYLDQEIA